MLLCCYRLWVHTKHLILVFFKQLQKYETVQYNLVHTVEQSNLFAGLFNQTD